jgi:site-specific recombinase XerD
MAERTLKIPCPPPARVRPDDQVVELFLHAWQSGRFTHSLDWLPQNRRHVEVIATDTAGERLAVQHTRIFAFEDHKRQEELLQPIAEALERETQLNLPDRRFELFFLPNFLEKAVSWHRDLVDETLVSWAIETLLHLPLRCRRLLRVPVPLPSGKVGHVLVVVAVSARAAGMAPVSVTGCLPDDPQRLRPVVRKALADKLPKLADAQAGQRVLLLELPITASKWKVMDTVREMADDFPLLARVNRIVAADTFAFRSEGYLVFWVWDLTADDFTEILQPVITAPPALLPTGPLASLAGQAREFAAAAKAGNTLRAYTADWEDFRKWCSEHHVSSLPATPGTVALYLTDRAATLKTSSLARRLTTINRAHEAAGHPSPATMRNAVVSEVWKGIRRTKGIAEEGKKPFLTADLKKIVAGLPDDLQGLRDRALLLSGFAGGFRRSELARLRVEDLKPTSEGMVALLRRSKTDQEGQGRPVALPYGSDPLTCPVRALNSWIRAAAISSGPLFRAVDQLGMVSAKALAGDSVAWIVKRAAKRAGMDAADYSGHSLRAGLATQAAMNGAGELAIMKQTGHRSLATVRRYIRDGALFRDNAATKLGL